MAEPNPDGPMHPEVHRETADINIRGFVWFAGVMIVLAVVIQFAVYVILEGMKHERNRVEDAPITLVAGAAKPLPVTPRLQPFPEAMPAYAGATSTGISGTPAYDMRQMRKDEDLELSTYGWIDQQKGIVRIPIDRAIDIMTTRGFPVRSAPAPLPIAAESAIASSQRNTKGSPPR